MLRDKSSLIDILNACESIAKFIGNKSIDNFYEDEILQAAIIRKFEIVGEASNRISDDLKNNYSELPWKKMKALRNILIHMYDELDLDIIWDTAIRDIPGLKNKIEKIIPLIKE